MKRTVGTNMMRYECRCMTDDFLPEDLDTYITGVSPDRESTISSMESEFIADGGELTSW